MENDSSGQEPLNPAPPPSGAAALPASADKPDALVSSSEGDSPPDDNILEYHPDDYRWVPVRRKPRYDGWTEEKQRRFIEILADTGIVSHAAKAVGMTRESAARLRRSPHGASFARAWDAARHHAGSFLEDVAFERAIEGVEQNVFNEYGEVVCTKRVYNDRLLTFLLRHLKPERYGRDGLNRPAPQVEPAVTLEASLREMEPQLPAPPEEMLGLETMACEIEIAEIADGKLPQFLSEQPHKKTAGQLAAEEILAQQERGEAACKKLEGKEEMSDQEWLDMCRHLDPSQRNERPRRLYR